MLAEVGADADPSHRMPTLYASTIAPLPAAASQPKVREPDDELVGITAIGSPGAVAGAVLKHVAGSDQLPAPTDETARTRKQWTVPPSRLLVVQLRLNPLQTTTVADLSGRKG